MRILFAALHDGYYRNVESVIEELARRGHQIYLGNERPPSSSSGSTIAESLARRFPQLTYGRIPGREADTAFLASKVRLGLDYLRYLEPIYNRSSGLLPRARVRTPVGIVRLMHTPFLSRWPARGLVARALDTIERATPASPAIENFLDEQRPDFVIVTPLIGLVASSQLDLLRSAQVRRLPTAVLVWSWDHLSSKARIRDVPDGLFVWNDAQKTEAIEMHGIPEERIVVTGAQCFDQWFGRNPTRLRGDFIRRAKLPDERPYVLWVCSALLPGSPPESDLVMRWATHLRASANARLRETPILVRPHPSRMTGWAGFNWDRIGRIAFFGENPTDDETRSDYFDSLYHSAAVVGITTTAFIEAAIVGRPVMTILFDDVRQEHAGSLHFQLLLNVAGGVMTVARSLEEHERQLGDMIDGPPQQVLEQEQRFVAAFVRPHGMEVRATDVLADALERLGSAAPVVVPRPAFTWGRVGLRALTALERHPRWRNLLLDEREAANAVRQGEKLRLRQEALARKDQQRAEKIRRAAQRSR